VLNLDLVRQQQTFVSNHGSKVPIQAPSSNLSSPHTFFYTVLLACLLGQYSLTLALEELGFPTLHTIHLYTYENEEILHMLTDRLFKPAFAANEPLLGDADVKLIAESGYQAIADLPMGLFYEKILRDFPDCKFILTTRENSEVWFQSWTTLTKSITTAMYVGGHLFPTLRHYSDYLRWLYAFVNKDASYLTAFVPKDHSIKENAIATYENHNRQVREVIPAAQLLEYSVKEGWVPLCNFLEIAVCPDTPFPKSNSGRQMRAQSSSAFCAVGFFLLFLINLLRKSMQRKKRKKMD